MASTCGDGKHPVIKAFSDLDGIIETFGFRDPDNPESKYTKYTTCHVYDDGDKAYFGQVFKEKKKITVEEFASSLQPVPDEEIYPKIPLEAKLKVASTMGETPGSIFIKRPSLLDYEEASGHEWIRQIFLAEALIMEQIAATPHPNIVKYFGCRMRNSRLAGIVLERHESSPERPLCSRKAPRSHGQLHGQARGSVTLPALVGVCA